MCKLKNKCVQGSRISRTQATGFNNHCAQAINIGPKQPEPATKQPVLETNTEMYASDSG